MSDKEQEYMIFYKRNVLEELLGLVNDICSKHGLSYFAMSKLLACVVENRGPEANDGIFCIGMMREDFDRFFEEMEAIAKEKKISVMPFYDKDFYVTKIHSRISIKRTFKGDKGERIEIALELRVEPLEFLPDDPVEKEQFLKENARLTREYRAGSKAQLEMKKTTVQPEKGFLKRYNYYRNQKKTAQKFEKQHREYRNHVHKYHGKAGCSHVARIELLMYAEHKLTAILPMTRMPYGKTSVMVPADIEEFIVHSAEQERKLSIARKFELLRRFDALCTKEGLPYFLMKRIASLGTNIQEDSLALDRVAMKIGMMRSDYDRLMELFKEEKSDGLFLNQTVEDYLFIKDHRNKISLCPTGKKFPGFREIFLYLYPFDRVPKKKNVYRKMQDEIAQAYNVLDEIILEEKGLSQDKKASLITSWDWYARIEEMKQRYNETEEDSYHIYTYDKGRFISLVKNQVYPVVRKSYGRGTALYPSRDFLWCRNTDETYCAYGQERQMDLLRRVDDLCQKNELEYFAVKELLIGATVYEDFIPDSELTPLSIGLVRDQYEALLNHMRDHAQDYGLKLCEYFEERNQVPLPLKCILDAEDCYPSALRIDLYPFDRIPEDFYVQQGFQEDMMKNNEEYRYLAAYHTSLRKDYIKDYTANEYAAKEPAWKMQNPMEEYQRVNDFAQSFKDSEHAPYLGCVAFRKIRMIHEKDLYELKKYRFRDIMVPCPRDYSVWQPMVDEELNKQVSNIQKYCIRVLEEFARVCKEIGVGFFLCGGTLLGYARNGGYIPWDDDIDVGMLRADYDLFLEKAADVLKPGFFLQTREEDPNIPYLFTKLRMDGTVWWSEFIAGRDFHTGICIDIFPFDYLPNDLSVREAQVEQATRLYREHLAVAKAQYPEPEIVHEPVNALEERYHKEQEAKRQEAWSKNLADSHKEYLKVATQYNARASQDGLKTVGSFVVSYTYIDLEDLLPYKEVVFEGVNAFIPKREDVFLHMQYGDYMQLPPKHKRMAHRLLYWSTGEQSGGRLKEEVEKGGRKIENYRRTPVDKRS